jgi:hypothetical protein
MRVHRRPGLRVHHRGDPIRRPPGTRGPSRRSRADRDGDDGRRRVAISGTVLEILQRAGLSSGGRIDLVFVILAAALLPAGLVLIIIARERGRGDLTIAGQVAI